MRITQEQDNNLILIYFSLAEKLGHWYYFNTINGKTQWTHPADTVIREKVERARKNCRVDLNSKFSCALTLRIFEEKNRETRKIFRGLIKSVLKTFTIKSTLNGVHINGCAAFYL